MAASTLLPVTMVVISDLLAAVLSGGDEETPDDSSTVVPPTIPASFLKIQPEIEKEEMDKTYCQCGYKKSPNIPYKLFYRCCPMNQCLDPRPTGLEVDECCCNLRRKLSEFCRPFTCAEDKKWWCPKHHRGPHHRHRGGRFKGREGMEE